jgi:uncharacterized protein involved in exopolysaccharide biosynthesis
MIATKSKMKNEREQELRKVWEKTAPGDYAVIAKDINWLLDQLVEKDATILDLRSRYNEATIRAMQADARVKELEETLEEERSTFTALAEHHAVIDVSYASLRAELERVKATLVDMTHAKARCNAPSDSYDIPCQCCVNVSVDARAALQPEGKPCT